MTQTCNMLFCYIIIMYRGVYVYIIIIIEYVVKCTATNKLLFSQPCPLCVARCLFCLHIWDLNPLGHILNSIFVLIHKPTAFIYELRRQTVFSYYLFSTTFTLPFAVAFVLPHTYDSHRYYYIHKMSSQLDFH